MKAFCHTGATLLLGAGLGISVSRLLSINGEEQEDNLLNRLPVVPVVQASELTVSTRACWYLNRRRGYTLRGKVIDGRNSLF